MKALRDFALTVEAVSDNADRVARSITAIEHLAIGARKSAAFLETAATGIALQTDAIKSA